MTEKSTLKKRLQSYHNPKLILKSHESCKHHELRQIMNYNKDEKECPYKIHIKCLKGHKLTETSANECNDYELTDKQIKDYSKSELFIFNGLNDEKEYRQGAENNITHLKKENERINKFVLGLEIVL